MEIPTPISIEGAVNYQSRGHNRLLVVCRVDKLYDAPETFWPTPNMTFFLSTGTSNINKGYEWLRGTFFPTSGLACSSFVENQEESEANMVVNNKISDFHECTDSRRQLKGHIVKMSDYMSEGFGSVFYGLEHFLDDLGKELLQVILKDFDTIICSRFDKDNLSNRDYLMSKYPDLMNANNATNDKIFNLNNAFTYFITEQQLKLSYCLTPDNTGLWSFTCGDFSLSEFCKKRWGNPSKIYLPDIETITGVDEAYDFIVSQNANIEFSEMKKIIKSGGKTYNLSAQIFRAPFARIINAMQAMRRKIRELTPIVNPSEIAEGGGGNSLQVIQQEIPDTTNIQEEPPPKRKSARLNKGGRQTRRQNKGAKKRKSLRNKKLKKY
jgi:hypothetical protein